MSTRCLVLGAGGFIGTNLCKTLIAGGAVVTGFGRRRSYPEALAGVHWIAADFADRLTLARALEGQDVVYHLIAGSVPETSNRDKLADLMDGPAATLHLLELCRTAQPGRLVFASSGGTVYGVPARTPIAEDAPTEPISAYGVSRLTIEKYLYLYQHQYGLRSTVLRVANAFGPFQDPRRRQGVVPALLRRALDGEVLEVWGDGRVVRDFVHVDDVVAALIAAAGYAGSVRVMNVGSGVGRSITEILADIGTVLGREPLVTYRPGRAVDVPVNVLDIALIGRELGWAPRVAWLDGLRGTAAWLAG